MALRGLVRPSPGYWLTELEPGRSGRVCARAPSVPPLRPGQRPRHSRCQYHIAPGSVGAPSASSVPHRARVSGRAICVVTEYPTGPSRQDQWARRPSQCPPGRPPAYRARRQLRREGRRAHSVPQLEPTAGRVTCGTNARTTRNRLGPGDSSEQAGWRVLA